jgi:hypothetical protein
MPIRIRVAVIKIDEIGDGNTGFGEWYVIVIDRLSTMKKMRLKTQRGRCLVYQVFQPWR